MQIHINICTQEKNPNTFMRRLSHFAFPQWEPPRTSSGTEERAGRRAEDRQQGSRSSVIMTPQAGYCRVRAPEGISRLCWGWRGQRTGGRPWSSPGTVWLQGLRQSWPYRSCMTSMLTRRTLLPPHHLLQGLPFILLERCQCLSQAGTITHDKRDPRATGSQVAKCR